MSFSLTTDSLCGFVVDTVHDKEDPLAALLIAYEGQLEDRTATPDRRLLEQATALLEQRLHAGPPTADTARLGEALYRHRGERHGVIDLLTRYLSQPLDADEEVWARWHIVDCLALSRRCDEAIAAQGALLQRAQSLFPLGTCLWVMNDTTQALCWVHAGRGPHWLHIYDDLMARVEATAHNRLDRFYYVRTAAWVHLHGQRHDQALRLADLIERIAHEDPAWERGDDVRGEALIMRLNALQQGGRAADLRRVAAQATAALEAYERTHSPLTRERQRRLRVLCHNAAAPLYRSRNYDLAIPLFRRAVRLGASAPHAYIWLAASLWASTKDRAEVLPLLAAGARRDPLEGRWARYRLLPEFEDVRDDAEFAQATTV